jgi:hypothetical protein
VDLHKTTDEKNLSIDPTEHVIGKPRKDSRGGSMDDYLALFQQGLFVAP